MIAEKVFSVLSNPMRLQILQWLKDPDLHFPPMEHLPEDEQGKGYVCVSVIQEKSGISQSTISQYLTLMKQAELLSSKRIGQWTYYRRDEKTIQDLAEYVSSEL